MSVIKVKDALQMLRLQPCTIVICTLDLKRKTGGGRKTFIDCMIATATEKGTGKTGNTKMPGFKQNATINIRCANGEPVTIHPCLIESLNGKRVTI